MSSAENVSPSLVNLKSTVCSSISGWGLRACRMFAVWSLSLTPQAPLFLSHLLFLQKGSVSGLTAETGYHDIIAPLLTLFGSQAPMATSAEHHGNAEREEKGRVAMWKLCLLLRPIGEEDCHACSSPSVRKKLWRPLITHGECHAKLEEAVI